jgi:hypothetical protein
MLWWWQIIAEENLYPVFAAFSRFMSGEDRRGTDMSVRKARVSVSRRSRGELAAHCFGNAERALGWIYYAGRFRAVNPVTGPKTEGVAVRLEDMREGRFEVEYWDTAAGRIILKQELTSREGVLTMSPPPFSRDIAFKLRRKSTR